MLREGKNRTLKMEIFERMNTRAIYWALPLFAPYFDPLALFSPFFAFIFVFSCLKNLIVTLEIA